MKIPKTIYISGVRYTVVETSGLNNGVNVAYGQIDYEKSIIELNPDNQSHQHKCTTLLHEIIHGICKDRDLDFSTNENVVDALAKGIYQILQDNGAAFFDLSEKI